MSEQVIPAMIIPPPVEENPEVDLPSGAPELAGTFEEYCNLAAPDMDENTVAGWLMYMVCAIGQQEAHEDPIGTTTEKTYIIDGDSIPEAGASYWGSFTMDITENKMSASGRLSLMDRFVFDISGYMTEVDGIIEINGQEYSFLTPSLGID